MKQTLNINLAGYPFTIDDDAYRMLKDYLDTIRYAFKTKEDTEDLASDIEFRIAEILIENQSGSFTIITLDEISKVIERIGKPADFIDIENEVETITPPPYQPKNLSRNPFVRKRIFRDPQNAMLGGVCAGLAWYFHIDVTIIRLIAVLLLFLSATTVAIVYIVLWIVIPEARTPLQRMKMMGEDTTVENIGKTVTGCYQDNEPSQFKPEQKNSFATFLSNLFSIFIKILIFFGLLISIPLLIALSAGLVGCIIAAFVIGIAIVSGITEASYGWFDSSMEGQLVFYILLAVIGGIITVGIPLWLLFKMLWRRKDTNQNTNYNSTNQKSLSIIWLCGIALLSVFTVKSVKKAHEINSDNLRVKIESISELNVTETEENGDITTESSTIIELPTDSI